MPFNIAEGHPSFHSRIPQFILFSGIEINTAIFGVRPERFLSSLYRKKHGYYSFTRSWLAVENGNTLSGCVFALDYAIIRNDYFSEVLIHLFHPLRLIRQYKALRDAEQIISSVEEHDCYITHLAVLPERRSMGIGEALLMRAVEFYRGKGRRRVLLDVDSENTGAVRFYKRCGFSELFFRKVPIAGSIFPLIRMGMIIQ
jgi:GNAT superfamily N-acetyltransferase